MLSLESLGEISRKCLARDVVAVAERSRERLERITATRDENEVMAVASEEVGNIAAYSARRAGDDRQGSILAASSERGRRRCGHGETSNIRRFESSWLA
jgi:hypothetical protein